VTPHGVAGRLTTAALLVGAVLSGLLPAALAQSGTQSPAPAQAPAPAEAPAAAPGPADAPEIDIADAPVLGAADAPVTIVEFSDFQCTFCARGATALRWLMQRNPGKFRWVFKHYPIRFAGGGSYIHQVALAAQEQGKFWEMHELLFTSQDKTGRFALKSHLPEFAQHLDLDLAAMQRALKDGRLKDRVERDYEEGRRLRIAGTPTYFINGRRVVGSRTISEFRIMIDAAAHAGTAPAATR
jgi:protein-disulfide isomerase